MLPVGQALRVGCALAGRFGPAEVRHGQDLLQHGRRRARPRDPRAVDGRGSCATSTSWCCSRRTKPTTFWRRGIRPALPNVEVRRIPGLRFHYTSGRLDLTRSVARGLGYLWKLPGLVGQLKRAIRDERPDLVVTDFEPALPRAARACGVPLVSLNHQHFLVACDLSSLPLSLRGYAKLMGLVSEAHLPRQDADDRLFVLPLPLRGAWRVQQVGPLLRPELQRATATRGDYLLSYLRPILPRRGC